MLRLLILDSRVVLGKDGNLRCESRMDRKSFWGWSQTSEWIASDEC